MYFKEKEIEGAVAIESSNRFVIILTTVLTLVIGLVPGLVAEMFKF